MFSATRPPSCDGMSPMIREVHVRICEGLGVKLPGPTRQFLPIRPPSGHGSNTSSFGSWRPQVGLHEDCFGSAPDTGRDLGAVQTVSFDL